MENIKLFSQWGEYIPFSHITFSGGEEHINLSDGEVSIVVAKLRSSQDILTLLLLVNAIKERGDWGNVTLHLPYIPYARQDRVCAEGDAFGLKVFTNLLNSCEFSEVVVVDPHSDVAPALINNCVILDQAEVFTEGVVINSNDNVICAPDGGAVKKCFKVASKLSVPMITAEKVRDTSDGSILETRVNCESLVGKVVWMVDDICDGGMTFIKLAEALYTKGAKEVNLHVTHGIFSKGKKVLTAAGIKNIFAVHDWTKTEEIKL